MSLTSHLKDQTSPIGQFIRQHFAYTSSITKEPNRQLRSSTTLHPTTESAPYGTLGTSIDYRIRYAFGITSSRQLKAWYGARSLTYKPLRNKNDIPIDLYELVRVIGGIRIGINAEVAQGPYPLQLVMSFFDSLDITLNTLQPVGRLLELESERTLARYCFVLSLFEEVFRSQVYQGNGYKNGPLMVPTTKSSVEELLAIPHDEWIDDLCTMFTLFYDRYYHLLSHSHVLNPSFTGSKYVGQADADIIVDGCLIDIKASISPDIEARYLYQLAGYLLLDFDDKLHIDSVAIYMARQGIMFTWPIHDFLHLLSGDNTTNIASLRQEFRTLCENMRKRNR